VKRFSSIVALFVVALVALAGCGTSTDGGTPTEQTRSGTLRVAIGQDAPTLDPARVTDTTSHEVTKQMYEGLVAYDKELNIVASLASSWDISPDGTLYTFHLRDAKFATGDPVTANDVKWSFERVLNPATKSERTWIFDEVAGAFDYTAGKAQEVTGIVVKDDKTVEIKLTEYSPIFLHKMTYSAAYIVNRKIIESYDNNEAAEEKTEIPAKEGKEPEKTESQLKSGLWHSYESAGTGPFKLQEWKKDQKVVLIPNDNYWGQKSMVETLVFPVIKDDTIRMQEYQAGNIDVLYPIPDADFERVKNDPQLSTEISQVKDLAIYYIGFQNKLEPFTNKKVRQAFNMAVNRQDIVDKIFKGRHTLATGIIPPSMPNYKSLTDAYPYDPTKAKQLLEEAIKEGAKVPSKVVFAFNQGNVTHKNIAEFIQEQIKGNLGIDLQLESVEWATYLKRIDDGAFPMFRLGWVADYPDPDNFLWVLLDSSNAGPKGGGAFYSNPNFDKLVRDAKKEKDNEKRMGLYAEAEKIAMEDACWMPIVFQNSWTLVKPNVTGYFRNAMGPMMYNTVKIGSK